MSILTGVFLKDSAGGDVVTGTVSVIVPSSSVPSMGFDIWAIVIFSDENSGVGSFTSIDVCLLGDNLLGVLTPDESILLSETTTLFGLFHISFGARFYRCELSSRCS